MLLDITTERQLYMEEPEAQLSPQNQPPLYTPVMATIESLTPSDYNPRELTDDGYQALKDSMQNDPDFFKVKPIVANIRNGHYIVVMGNQRLKVAKDLGFEKVPVVFVQVDPETEAAWNIKDNLHQGQFVPDKLKGVLMDLHSVKFNMTSLGMTPKQLITTMGKGLLGGEDDPSDDPDYQGAPGKKQREVECPDCGHKFMA